MNHSAHFFLRRWRRFNLIWIRRRA